MPSLRDIRRIGPNAVIIALLASTVGCRTSDHEGANSLADANDAPTTKSPYHATHYVGKSSYIDNADRGKCYLSIYTNTEDHKLAAVRFRGLTRDFEPNSYAIGGSVDENQDRIELKNNLERVEYKDIAIDGYTRIARSEETVKNSLTAKRLIIVDVAVRGETQDFFGSVIGTEVYKLKMLGGLTMEDSGHERETVSCDAVRKVSEEDTEELPK